MGRSVIAVSHGETMWAFRLRLERMSQVTYRKLDESDDKRDRIHNAQIIQYTRIDPHSARAEEPCNPSPYYKWMRSVCPTDENLSWNKWAEIERQTYTNEELLQNVERYPRTLHDG